MKQQRGITLISTLILGMVVAAGLVLALRLVPVYTEFFAVKGAFTKVITSTDSGAPAAQFRTAFQRYADIDDIKSVDPQTIIVDKDAGKVTMHVSYRREVALFGNAGLYFDFNVSSD